MSKTILVTDEDALANAGDLRDREYVDVNGLGVSGEDVVRSIETGAYDTSKLEPVAPMEPVAATDGASGPEPSEGGGQSVLGGASNLVNRLGAFFLEYKILGKLVKSDKGLLRKGLTVGSILLGQYLDVLPTSISPLLGAASGLVGTVLGPEASAVLDKVRDVIPEPAAGDASLFARLMDGTLDLGDFGQPEGPRATVTEGSDFLERDEGDGTLATAEDRVRAVYANVFGEEAPDLRTTDPEKVREYMEANGKLMATDGVFASCADKEDTDREFAGMRAVTSASCAMLEEAADGSAEKAVRGYLTMAKGLSAYEAGALDGFAEKYPDGASKAEAGLDKVMDASRGPLIGSILRMQAERGLFSDKEMEELEELVPGLSDQALAADIAASYGQDACLPDPDAPGAERPSGGAYGAFPAPARPVTAVHKGVRGYPDAPSGGVAEGPEAGPEIA